MLTTDEVIQPGKLIMLFVLMSTLTFGQKISYTVDANGVHFAGVDQTNPVIYDNDIAHDSPDIWYLWLKANRKEINLVGNINSKDGHAQGVSHDKTFSDWTTLYNYFKSMGGQNVPAPIKGASRNYSQGSTDSPGETLIISEAKKASPSKPLVILVGGQVSTVANAITHDASIIPNIIVFHIDGFGKSNYNCIDNQACALLLDRGVKYINWDGDLNSWYPYSASNKMPGINLNGMPSNNFSNAMRNWWFGQAWKNWGHIADGPISMYFFDHSLWKNIQRKDRSNNNTTSDNFSFLLVSQNDWNAYGPMLNSFVVNPESYKPATTPPDPPDPQPEDRKILNLAIDWSTAIITVTYTDGSVQKFKIQAL